MRPPGKRRRNSHKIGSESTSVEGQFMKKRFFTRIAILIIVGFSLLAVFIAAEKWLSKSKTRLPGATNVLLITLDTTRADHIGAYGYSSAKTPALDRLAADGCLFENCYTSVPLTLPSHSSLLTGRYPPGHNVRNNGKYVLSEHEITIQEVLKDRNYITFAAVGSYILHSKFGLGQGFDVYDDSLSLSEIHHNYDSEIPADIVYRKFQRWFEKNSSKTFFAWIHFFDPHAPYLPPKAFATEGASEIARYDGEIAFVDTIIEKMIIDLERKGVLDNTLLVVAGDHGEAFGEHGEKGHGIFCYEEVLKVPLIIRHPGITPPGNRIAARVNLVDVMPSIMDLLGFENPQSAQGASLVSLLKAGKAKDRLVYFESFYGKEEKNWAPLTGIIDQRFKFISLPNPEIYDLGADQSEKHNLFAERNQVAERMADKLKGFTAANELVPVEAATRELTQLDVERLKSLGYLSPETRQKGVRIDPKLGILVQDRLDEIKARLDKGEAVDTGKELDSLMLLYPNIRMPLMFDLKRKILMSEKKLDEALATLDEAVRTFPEHTEFKITLANYFYGLDELEKSEKVCRDIIEEDPRYTRAYTLLGDIQAKRQNFRAAVASYQEAVSLEPENVLFRIAYAGLLVREKQPERAVAVVNEIVDREDVTANPDMMLSIAVLNVAYGSPRKAELLLEKCVRMKPSGLAYFYYALALGKNSKSGEAIKAMEIALARYAPDLDMEQIAMGRDALRTWKGNLSRAGRK